MQVECLIVIFFLLLMRGYGDDVYIETEDELRNPFDIRVEVILIRLRSTKSKHSSSGSLIL